MAYSRDPRDMFAVARHDAPLNRKPQPITYTDITLGVDIAPDLAAGEEYPFLEVNWLTGTVRAFYDAEDALSKVPYIEASWGLPPCEPRPAYEYLYETDAFMARGHSLGALQCCCSHGLSDQRAAELGITTDNERGDLCVLDKIPRACSAAELSSELGVRDVQSLCTADGYRLWDLLCGHRSVGVKRSRDGTPMLTSTRYHVGALRNKADLIRAVYTSKNTFAVPKDGYPGMQRDIAELVASKQVASLYDGTLLYWLDSRYDIGMDADVSALWFSALV